MMMQDIDGNKNLILYSLFRQILLGSIFQNMSSLELRVDYFHLSPIYQNHYPHLKWIFLLFFALTIQINPN